MSEPNSNPDPALVARTHHMLSALADYWLKNPFLVLWNVALLLGGSIAFVHFMSIGYFPELDVKTASAFLLGIALLGLLLSLVLATTFVVPSYLIRSEVWLPYCVYHSGEIGGAAGRIPGGVEKKRRLPFALMSFFHGTAAFFLWMLLLSFRFPESNAHYAANLRIVCGIGLLVSSCFLIALFLRAKNRDAHEVGPLMSRLGRKRGAQHLLLTLIWVAICPGYLILLALAASKLQYDDITGHVCLVAFIFVFMFANAMLAVFDLSSARAGWIFPSMATILLLSYLSLPSNPFSITRSVFSSFAIGDLDRTSFVVKRPTCDAVNLLVTGACRIASETLGCIRPKSLANRIGNEYLLVLETASGASEVADTKEKKPVVDTDISIPIPKSEVLTWGRSSPGVKGSSALCGPSVPNKR